MKRKFLLPVGLSLLVIFGQLTFAAANEHEYQNNSITVLSTPEVQTLTETLVSEYRIANPGININNRQLSDAEITNEIPDASNIIIASENSDVTTSNKSGWKMLIGRDVIVPVVSTDCPFNSLIDHQGISSEKLKAIVSENTKQVWGTLIDTDEKNGVNLFVLDDASVQESVMKFLGINSTELSKFEKVSPEELKQKMQQDKYALGFSRLLNVADSGNETLTEKIRILPLDKNNNGRLDYHEKIYADLDKFNRGVWLGKYPNALVNNIYFVSDNRPVTEKTSAFLGWVLTDGQSFMESNGLNMLVYNERKSKLDELNRAEIPVGFSTPENTGFGSVLLIIIGIAAAVLIFSLFVRGRAKTANLSGGFSGGDSGLNEDSVEIPNGLYFDKTHTWTFMEKDGSVRVGVDDFMQNVTGKYTAVKMKDPGEQIRKNEAFITLVQNGKHISLYAPVSGMIKEINEDLVTDPSLINDSPYNEGWIYSIEPTNWSREIGFLKMAEKYKEWLKKEIVRLKDFLANAVNPEQQVAYQEGGEINANVLKELGPHTWEDFQKNFIDNSDIN